MTESATAETEAPATVEPETKPKKKQDSFAVFLIKLVVIVLVFRTFIFTSFMIPSESMMPRLLEGDYLFAAKWPYGYSRASLPLDSDWVGDGRVFGGLPERGDVVIFKHPVDGTDYIKRAIGLPGDTLEMRGGQIILNGDPVPKQRIGDFVIAVSPNTDCAWGAVRESDGEGGEQCRYARFRETLPSGLSYEVLDFGLTPQDDFGPVIVPEGSIFVLGDNRDNSQDSRFPSMPAGGVGLVPLDNLVGRASAIMWSTDGGANWLLPWTWFTAARWSRIGDGL